MVNQSLLDAFKSTKYFDNLKKDTNVVAVVVSGSRVFGYDEKDSDHDLFIFTKEKIDLGLESTIKYCFNGMILSTVKVHYPIQVDGNFPIFSLLGVFKYYFISDQDILYINEKYKDAFNEKIHDLNFYKELYEKHKDFIELSVKSRSEKKLLLDKKIAEIVINEEELDLKNNTLKDILTRNE